MDCSHARLAGHSSALRQASIELDETLITHSAFSYDAGRQVALDCLIDLTGRRRFSLPPTNSPLG
jgi:hypothetical protein